MSISFPFMGYEASIEKLPMPDGNPARKIRKNGVFSGRAIIARTGPDYLDEKWVLIRSHAKTPAGDELLEKQEPALAAWLLENYNAEIFDRLFKADAERRAS